MSKTRILDLPSKIRALGLPVMHVAPDSADDRPDQAPAAHAALSRRV